MKKVLIFASLVFGMIPVAFAQERQGHANHEGHNHGTSPDEKATKAGEAWQKKLGLSDDEKAQFVAAKKTYMAKISELRKTKPVDKAAVATAKTDFDNSVKAAFTPEHYAAWKKTKEEIKKKRADKKGKKDKKGNKGGSNDKPKKVAPKDDKDSGTEDLEDDDDIEGSGN
jgi:hypothetical protein